MKKTLSGKSGAAKRLKRSHGKAALPAVRSARSSRDATPAQRKYVKGRIAGATKKKAALDAGFAESTAENAKQKIDKRPAVQALFKELLVKAGVTDALLAKRIYQGLYANVVSKETQFANREILVDFKERREMVELAGKIKGLIVDKVEVDAGPTLADLLEESFRG